MKTGRSLVPKKSEKTRGTKTKISPINNNQLQHITDRAIQSKRIHSYFFVGRKEPNIKE
jgi:hypothetical protein